MAAAADGIVGLIQSSLVAIYLIISQVTLYPLKGMVRHCLAAAADCCDYFIAQGDSWQTVGLAGTSPLALEARSHYATWACLVLGEQPAAEPAPQEHLSSRVATLP